MKTLLQINSVVNTGSTGRIAEEIGQAAISNGWNSYIAYARSNRSSQSKLIKIGNSCDIHYHGLQTRLFDRHGLASVIATKVLIKQIININPDIIHLHNIHGYYLNYKILFEYLKKNDIPIVWSLHDCWPMTGHCAHFTYVGCEKWMAQCYSCPQKNEYPGSFFIDRSKQNYIDKRELFNSISNMTIVPVSKWLGGIVEESFLKKHPIQIINNGIDVKVFSPQVTDKIKVKYNLTNKFVMLGVATAWGRKKGINDFIKLSKSLKDDEIIILVGLKEKQIKELPDNIVGIARTESIQELADFYSVADVFLNPTWEDSFPTVNLESLACGTPVITYKTGGSPEAIDDFTGIIVDKGNINGLVDAIAQIKEKGKAFYTTACRKRALDKYKKEDRYQDYLEIYKNLISKKSNTINIVYK